MNKTIKKKLNFKTILFILILLILLFLFIGVIKKSSIKKNVNREYAFVNINGGTNTINISNIISSEPNPPALGAGMIPIKWNGEKWVITSKEDSNWYDYTNAKWAYIMLSDGYYKSEQELGKRGVDFDLASENLEVELDSEKMGTIFVWIPRLCYNENQIEFLKGTSIVEYQWTTEKCFNQEKYSPNNLNLSFEGIWVGHNEFASESEVITKNSEMNFEDNIQGLIPNEMVSVFNSSDKLALQKLYEKCGNEQYSTEELLTMKYRQTIKILNTNKLIPIEGEYETDGSAIKIKTRYMENQMQCVLDENGNMLQDNKQQINNGKLLYVFYIVDNVGNIRKYSVNYGTWRPYLEGFSKSNTFYVTYDGEGNEDSSVPIGESEPAGWYDYDESKWANIVVRDLGNENYYVWIPRYMYKLDGDNEFVDAKFVTLENIWTNPETGEKIDLNNTEYKLPEAFTWGDEAEPSERTQLTGFWYSKFKLRENDTRTPSINGGSGKIVIDNIEESTNPNYVCEMYLIKDGKRIVWNEGSNSYVEGTTPIVLNGVYSFKHVEPGEYVVNIIVKDTMGNHVKAIANKVSVKEAIKPNPPELITASGMGFNPECTFYVTYDSEGNEDSSILISEPAPDGWYDYNNSKWANIVVRDSGKENYYVWIPRYEYSLNATYEKTNVIFIPTDKVTPDEGYEIPDAFSWGDEEVPKDRIQLSGFWYSKYKLRE